MDGGVGRKKGRREKSHNTGLHRSFVGHEHTLSFLLGRVCMFEAAVVMAQLYQT